MIEKINSQITAINNALEWIAKNKPEHYGQRFMQLVEERRKLRRLALAEKENPAIAAYGKSQVGKSYLMSCMLQKDGKPFLIKADGHDYNFINEMNPITKDTEATGVVTRFSSFLRNKEQRSERFPIMMKTLTVTDIILMLCDGYFNDLVDYTVPSGTEINNLAEQVYARYKDAPVLSRPPMEADDVLDMKDYFTKYINNAQALYNRDSTFFERLALVIDRVPVADYPDIFSRLWSGETHLSELFSRLLNTLQRLQFSSLVYLPVEAVLHHGINKNTIMSVQCLDGLAAEGDEKLLTDAYLRHPGSDSYNRVENLDKSEMSAICAEIVVGIDEQFLDSESSFDFEMIAPAVSSSISHSPIKKGILRTTDMLDFPGARSRKKLAVNTMQGKILTTVLLRGKVAYLFNKYSEARVINVLLFCHDNAQNDVADIPNTIDKWVATYVGRTPEERSRTIQICNGVSPLFYVATKFNIDMQEDQNPSANERNAIDGRWQARFNKVLYNECFNAEGVQWVKNWTRPGENFRNSYLLRDFKYSGLKTSKLYKGFADCGQEQELNIPRAFYDLLRQSFCESQDVRLFFDNPQKAWDVACTIRNDGTLYIIERMAVVSECLSKARDAQFEQQLSETRGQLLSILSEYHVSEDVDELLQENIRKAFSVLREMDFTCNDDSYFFGHLLQAMQVTETECLQRVHDLIQSGELADIIYNPENQQILRRCDGFKGCRTTADCWKRLKEKYFFRTEEEAAKYLAQRGIDAQQLFASTLSPRQNSTVIADKIFDLWQQKLKSVEFMNQILTGQQFDGVVMSTLVDDLVHTSEQLHLVTIMAGAIADYVNVIKADTINESLVADILSSTINDFVTDLGFSRLDADDLREARRIAQQYDLPVFTYIDKERQSHFDEQSLTALFNELTDSHKPFTTGFEDNYYRWLEYMFVSFIAHIEVPNFDREANEALGIIIKSIE